MKKQLLTLLSLFLALTTYSQSGEPNFDFEVLQNGIPVGWTNHGSPNYGIALDSATVKNGKYAVSIAHKEGEADFLTWSYHIPENYEGKKITLTGYIKTEDVTEGYAGLYMRIDPSIAFDNMQYRGIKGSTDWTQYEVTLDMNPRKTKQIIVGGLLAGKGKIWLDDLKVSIDGKDIKDLKPRQIYLGEQDTSFNQGSDITTIPTDPQTVEHLKALGQVWGFLKYHHPAVAAGNFNWDYELFRILPQVIKTQNEQERDEMLVEWIKGLGEFKEGKKVKTKRSKTKLEPDLDWIHSSDFSAELSALLLTIKNAERPQESYYIGLYEGVYNPEFKHEEPYDSQFYPDAGLRLLSLYRYWNIIQYYFPYRYLIEEDWNGVLEEFIPKMAEAGNETEYTLAVLELIARIHDSHAGIWDNPILALHWGTRYTATELTFVENKPVVTDYYDEKLGKETGLEIGDVITKINGQPIEEIIKEKLKYLPASNYPTQLRNLSRDLLKTKEPSIEVEFLRGDSETGQATLKTYTAKEVNRYGKQQVVVPSFKLIDEEIAYINNGSLKREELPEIWEALKDTKGLIIDNRNYPSDFVNVYALSEYLMPNSVPFIKFTHGSIDRPGLFTYVGPIRVGKKNKSSYKGKVVILINEISQSRAEFHAMGYRVHPNATVIGSTTAGADGNVSSFNLPGGISTMITGLGVYYPNGEETQRVGIVPDIEVKPTIQGVKEGRDELMEKAIEIINKP